MLARPRQPENLPRLSERLPPLLRIRVGIEIVSTYVEVRWRLARAPLPDVVATLRRGSTDSFQPANARLVGLRLAHPVRRTLDPLPWDSRCLMRSLVLLRMSARRGVFCRLVIAVRPGETFAAHAWVELDGRPLLPTLGYGPLSVL